MTQATPPRPRVAICLPSPDQIDASTTLCLMEFAFRYGEPVPTINHRCCFPHENRNIAVRAAKELGMEWLWFIDADMVFPPDTLTRLLAHDKDIVGGTYARRGFPHDALGQMVGDDARVCCDELVEMATMPTGMLLVRMSVFDKLKFPWFQPAYTVDNRFVTEDVYFCHQASQAGLQIWCDTGLSAQIGHRGMETFWIPQATGEETGGGVHFASLDHEQNAVVFTDGSSAALPPDTLCNPNSPRGEVWLWRTCVGKAELLRLNVAMPKSYVLPLLEKFRRAS